MSDSVFCVIPTVGYSRVTIPNSAHGSEVMHRTTVTLCENSKLKRKCRQNWNENENRTKSETTTKTRVSVKLKVKLKWHLKLKKNTAECAQTLRQFIYFSQFLTI